MAFQKSFTDTFGATHDESYWRLSSFEFHKEEGRAVLYFRGFANATAASTGKPALAMRQYELRGEAFTALLQKLTGADNSGASLAAQAYAFAVAAKDVSTGTNDENGAPVMVSFFDGAEAV